MKSLKNMPSLLSAVVLALGVSTAAQAQTAQRSFVHRTTVANKSGHITFVSRPSVLNDPNAVIRVTHNWNPPGLPGVYLNCIVGVYYASGFWGIFNQDTTCQMPLDASFNVAVGEGFVHSVTAANTIGHITYINNPLSNGNPNAIVTATHHWKGTYNKSDIGVWYDSSRAKWAIFNENTTVAMSSGMAFSVNISTASRFSFTAVVPSSTTGHTAVIDHPLLNGNPSAMIIITKNWSAAAIYNNSPASVYYDGTKWRVYFDDFKPIAGMAFNVEIL
ncbi:DUF7452 domain-containing protein [Hyalangium minutum]|uniref:DUF7452 domain-containing protein n=1 Tax=Hyalangium minutum TaxID=394096 RepID=A0A085WAZ0_9BACT|nr:hypothetical protein [Hyalangium minutum]KFE64853.1 hypothetical protein DB31_1871 [Hyalangium minutum]